MSAAGEPTPTIPITDAALELLRDNARFTRDFDYPGGLRCQAMTVAVSVDGGTYRTDDEAELRGRIIDRARAFEAYLRGDE